MTERTDGRSIPVTNGEQREALPCPMCGEQPTVCDLGGWEVICDCGVDYCSHTDPSKKAALAGWNRRALRSEPAPSRDADEGYPGIAHDLETMRTALERLGGMEAFVSARSIDKDKDRELLARIDFARAALKGSALPQVACSPSAQDTEESNGKCLGQPAAAALPVPAADSVVVPKEPTKEMKFAGASAFVGVENQHTYIVAETVYRAMLSAAPVAQRSERVSEHTVVNAKIICESNGGVVSKALAETVARELLRLAGRSK